MNSVERTAVANAAAECRDLMRMVGTLQHQMINKGITLPATMRCDLQDLKDRIGRTAYTLESVAMLPGGYTLPPRHVQEGAV